MSDPASNTAELDLKDLTIGLFQNCLNASLERDLLSAGCNTLCRHSAIDAVIVIEEQSEETSPNAPLFASVNNKRFGEGC